MEIVKLSPGRSGLQIAEQLGRIRGTRQAANYGALKRTAEQGLIHSHPHAINPNGKLWFPESECDDCPPEWAFKQDKAAEFRDYISAVHRGDTVPVDVVEANEQYEQEETQRAQAWLDDCVRAVKGSPHNANS